MRLSKTAWLILGIGIFAILFGSLGTVYLGRASEQRQLNSRLLADQENLTKLISQRADLDKALTRAKTELNTAKGAFPTSVESIEIGERLFELADDWDLEVTEFTSSEPTNQEAEDVTYFVTAFTVEVAGEVDDIVKFIDAIATHRDFATATLERVSMEVPEPLTEEEKEGLTEEEIEEAETPSATVQLVIYGYKGE